MENDENKKGLDILHPDPKPATPEWCHHLRMMALEGALKALEGATLSASDLVNLMKIRRSLEDEVADKPEVVWQDPPHWHPVQDPAEPDLAA